ncbi:TlpA family protein disulfide reductase [Faecalicatena sp. AGMB00832]|uniref:TlpA family protein disulfide reductase n=1 Tax=Faecalicatena faecalis TaxID=2726362 RepID=A0ABS6D3J8_9FIRM|nr:TlpA disulfide reductase family protein [Faecalicatena faecalis]MBU3876170.1 TlpA family protein disulfide reductase [Faecalicatena faecalis]
MKKKTILLTALLISALSLTACGNSGKGKEAVRTKPSELKTSEISKSDAVSAFGNFKLTKFDGTQTELTRLLQNAELTVLNIWDPSCESCVDEMKAFSTISGQYSGKGVQIVGIVRGVTEKQDQDALAVITKTDAHYLQLLDTTELDQKILNQYTETPTTLFLNRDGELLGDVYTGAKDQAFWEQEIEKYHSQVCVNDHPADCATG